jgi:hypothetical protein
MYFPPITESSKIELNSLKYTYCRILFRGSVTNLMSDFNGLDLYTSSVLGLDRFKLASLVIDELRKVL